jgi:hypothetical protein
MSRQGESSYFHYNTNLLFVASRRLIESFGILVLPRSLHFTNVQNGQDDCRKYYVSRDELKDLLQTGKVVLKDPVIAIKICRIQKASLRSFLF